MIYKGNVIRKFLIDRYAMGFSTENIISEFESVMGVPITEKEINEILKDAEPEIRQREEELLKELASQNVIGTLINIKNQLAEAAAAAKTDKDYKSFAQLSNSAIKSLEVIISIAEKLKNKEERRRITTIQNNFYAIEVLVKDGLIEVKDEKRLKEILGGT